MIRSKGKDRELIVVSNRLPFYKTQDEEGQITWHKAAGGLVTAMEPVISDAEGTWLGWDGFTEDIYKDSIDLFTPENTSYRVGCIPITQDESEAYYTRFSNSTLWGLFHYFFEKSSIDYEAWEAYKKINQRFASYIDKVVNNDDLVWIHDYHLFLTPYYLRELRPNLLIHFFLHIPFPHNDIFSILPWSRNIIDSLLCCNTVGFHHKQYCKNFEGAVERFRFETGKEEIKTHLYSNFISIDYDLINRTSQQLPVYEKKESIRKKYACPKLILGVDRVDYSKGIKERLLALESLFHVYPELKGKLIYYQLAVPSRENVESYHQLKKEIDEIVGRIVGEFSSENWTPIHYQYGTVDFEELVALYSSADIALVTPLRDGMNLVCKEYVASHSDEDGVLILSKFAGASAEISGCLLVNPYSLEEIREAIHKALHMPQAERKERMVEMRSIVAAHPISSWLKKCLVEFEA